MTSRRPTSKAKLAIPLLVFAAMLGVLTLVNGSSGSPAPRATGATAETSGQPRNTEELIESLQERVRADPSEAAGYAELGDAYLQRTRETGDFAFYSRAQRAFDEARAREPDNAGAIVGAGTLALARHDFGEGLRLGQRALALAPQTVRPYSVIVDGQIELGRYEAAARSLQTMIDSKPTLASYTRVSYYRELHGDLPGAIEAMRLAVSAGGGTPEGTAFAQTLLGDLLLNAGDVTGARRAYAQALIGVPGHLPARAGLARVDVARGRLAAAQRRLRAVSDRLPLPTYLTPLAEIELARGRRAAARGDLELIRAQRRLLQAAGTRTDVELVLFEADHGDAARAVRLGRRVLASAPSVRSQDALGWALTRAGRPRAGLRLAQRALRLGSVDPAFHYHAGMAAAATGEASRARRGLRRALNLNPSFSPYHAQRARRALARLS